MFKPQTHFNLEHIIPSGVGGMITINTVCKDCNSILGKAIDHPFLNNKAILFYRNHFNISRNEKTRKLNIPNPFNQIYYDEKGNAHTIGFVNGKITAKVVDRVEIFKTEESNKFIAKLTIPFEKKHIAEDILNKHLKRKKVNLTFIGDKREEAEESGSDIELGINIIHSSIMLGSLKIAYEFVSTLFPNYLEDEFNQNLLNYLLNPEENKYLIPTINKGSQELFEVYKKKLLNLRITPNCHAVIFENIKNYGLVCCVKIFEMILPFQMSQKPYDIPNGYREIIILNEPITQQYHSNISMKFIKRKFSVNLDHLDISTKNRILKMGEKSFFNSNENTPVYNKNGKIVFKDIFYLCEYLQRVNGFHLNIEQKNQIYLLNNENEYYFKAFGNVLVKLLHLEFTKEIQLFDIHEKNSISNSLD